MSPTKRYYQPVRTRSISADAGDVLTEDEGVDVVRPFISLYRFEVHHVAHDGIVLCDAVGAEDVAGNACAFQRHPHVVTFGHGDVFVANFSGVLETANVERE